MPYWGKDIDDPYMMGPIYLDEIHYYDHGSASAAQLAAFASGQVDSIYEFDIASYAMAASIPDSMIYEAQTAQTGTLAHAGHQEAVRRSARPAGDPALLRCGRLSGAGLPGPGHGRRASSRVAGPSRILRAAAAEARHRAGQEAAGRGRPSPTGSRSASTAATPTGPWQQQVCEILQGQLAPAGIKLNINLMPAEQYWAIWDQTPFGITAWTHRPLGTMVLSVGYRTGVPWNETKFASKEFDEALDVAEGLVDVEQRRAAMEKVEKILQDAAVMVQPLWQPKFFIASEKVQRHQGPSDAVPSVPSRLDDRLIAPMGRPGHRPGRRHRLRLEVPMLLLAARRLASMLLIMAVVSFMLFSIFETRQAGRRRQGAGSLLLDRAARAVARAEGLQPAVSWSATSSGSAEPCAATSAIRSASRPR